MTEAIIVIAIVAAAGLWLVLRAKKALSPKQGGGSCGCSGGCGAPCERATDEESDPHRPGS